MHLFDYSDEYPDEDRKWKDNTIKIDSIIQ